MTLSNHILSLSSSQSLVMAERANKMRAEGVDVIGLTLGQPDFHTPAHIKQAAQQAIADNYSAYGPVAGYSSLRQAIVDKLHRENNLTYTPNQIVVTTGAKQAIYYALQALVNPGDEVIIPTPCWVSYSQMVKLVDGVAKTIPTNFDNDYKLTATQLQSAITAKTKVLILCSPNNPTGSVYTKEELASLAIVLEQHPDIYVISDEIYEHLIYSGQHHSLAEFPNLKDRVIIINGVSKAYAMTGYRIGWLAAAEPIAAACVKLQSQETTCACTIAQKAAEAAYTGPQESVEIMRQSFLRRRDIALQQLREISGLEVSEPQGAFYLFPRCKSYYGNKIHNSDEMAEYLLTEAHVAVVAGSAYGDDDCFRISYAVDEEKLIEAIKRIKLALVKL